MMRLSVTASLLISVALVVTMFGVAYLTTEKDLLKPYYAVMGILVVAVTYNMLRAKVVSAMERCTIGGVMGSMMIMMCLLLPDVRWMFGAFCIGAGIFVILSPYLFKERWERLEARDR